MIFCEDELKISEEEENSGGLNYLFSLFYCDKTRNFRIKNSEAEDFSMLQHEKAKVQDYQQLI